MNINLFVRVDVWRVLAAGALLSVIVPAAAGAQAQTAAEPITGFNSALSANLTHASAAERCDLAEMAYQLGVLEEMVDNARPLPPGARRTLYTAATELQQAQLLELIEPLLQAARQRQPRNCPKLSSKGISVSMGGAFGKYGLSGVGLGYSGEEYAGLSPDTVNMSYFIGSIVNVGGTPWRLWWNYGEGLGWNGFEKPVGQEPYGGIYTGRSPSGATSVDTREKGAKGKNRVELRNFFAGGEIPIFKASRHTFTYFTFDRLERKHLGTISAQATFSGNNFFFEQRRDQDLEDSRFGAGIGRRFKFPLGRRFWLESVAKAGAYYRSASLASVERVTGNVMPQQDRDFTIQIRDTNNGIGFMGEFGATLEVPLSSQIALSGGGSVRILSGVSSIVNPRSSREIDDGGTTRIGSDRAMSGQLGINLVYRLGGK
jgi:hypothetical protein